MDVSILQVAETAPMHLKNAAGTPLYQDGKPVRILFYGPASRQFAELEAKQTARSVARHNDNDGKLVARSTEDRRREAVEDLADITYGFEHLTNGDKSGRELFESTYANPKLGFIIEQANRFLNNWGNFSDGSATN